MQPIDLHDLNQLQSSCTLRSRIVTLDERDGLQTHLIEAFPANAGELVSFPLILLLHGFPELAYSWRKILVPICAARGVIMSLHPTYEAPFHALNIVEDICSLIKTLGHSSVALLVGHDFGSIIAGHCVTAHQDLFQSVVFMSAPFTGVEQPQRLSFPNRGELGDPAAADKLLPSLAQTVSLALTALSPPRKYYTGYFLTRDANKDMLGERSEDLYAFLGGYYHMKSGAWEGNTTPPLPSALNPSPTIDTIVRHLATLPDYYVMPAHENMRQLIERHASQHAQFTWPIGEAEAGRIYASEFARTGFQGGLNYYRSALLPPPAERVDTLIALSGRKARVPAAFISGARDWGVYQTPGALDKMKHHFGMQNGDVVLIEGAGHWVQQEAPDQVVAALVEFLGRVDKTT
ncbi:Alpha/Beta hydrolase protein [Chiua virens]|nr:Alpha/Beta hydrolase protein [Chiua virens]